MSHFLEDSYGGYDAFVSHKLYWCTQSTQSVLVDRTLIPRDDDSAILRYAMLKTLWQNLYNKAVLTNDVVFYL